jgi:hypothetical protein
MKPSINYVVGCWSGNRRRGNEQYHEDRTYYLKCQLEALSKKTHKLDQITFVIPHNSGEPEEFSKFVEEMPKKIKKTKVVVLRRENKGQSYGSYSHAFGLYRDKFDYYIFLEDDYVFCRNRFDSRLVNIYKKHENCGFLCALVFPTSPVAPESELSKYSQLPHASISNGIAKTEVLEKIWEKFGCLPHSYEVNVGRNYSSVPQLVFSWAFIRVGTAGRLVFFERDTGKRIIYQYQPDITQANPLQLETQKDFIIPVQFKKLCSEYKLKLPENIREHSL